MSALLAAAAFVLAGERVTFDAQQRPRFSEHQIRVVAPEIRDGFARWAATESGRRSVARFNADEYEIVIVLNADEEGAGRAPQPALATLVAFGDHHAVKRYEIILNPEFRLVRGRNISPTRQPSTQADMMAAAIAGEMLHVDFYSRGISLPHHQRRDFQAEWREMARQLGYPDMKHEDDDDGAIGFRGTR